MWTLIVTCKTCAKVYDSTCQGTGIPSPSNWCATASDVGVSYTLGPIDPEYWVYNTEDDTCWTILSCPSGTLARYLLTGGITSEGNYGGMETVSFCKESGAGAGEWAVWLGEHIPLDSMRCQNA
ncbi:hypothetical protein CRE_18089 [Caenorhabditis remanei]|uniref:Uncharacterized protein n=1 Tax=Caenorhabditis remanei TaxID=31234 RepID=E3MTZ2_CAERE|nr:hypothetical protein CRE_18089 [Caenorhabditis remanei]